MAEIFLPASEPVTRPVPGQLERWWSRWWLHSMHSGTGCRKTACPFPALRLPAAGAPWAVPALIPRDAAARLVGKTIRTDHRTHANVAVPAGDAQLRSRTPPQGGARGLLALPAVRQGKADRHPADRRPSTVPWSPEPRGWRVTTRPPGSRRRPVGRPAPRRSHRRNALDFGKVLRRAAYSANLLAWSAPSGGTRHRPGP